MIEGDTQLLRIGLRLLDEKGNIFEIENVAMTEFRMIEDHRRYANVVLRGNIENLGTTLFIEEQNEKIRCILPPEKY